MDQVICIDDSNEHNTDIPSGLSKGSIYTVVRRCEICLSRNIDPQGILLSEIKPPQAFNCWSPLRFRPVRPTDISGLKALECTTHDERSGLTYPHIEPTKREGVI